MLTTLIPLADVVASDRLDFAFHNPLREGQIAVADDCATKRLGELCVSIRTGKTAAKGAYTDRGVRIVKVKNVRGDGMDWSHAFHVDEAFHEKARQKASVRPLDILMLCSAHSASYIGRADIVTDMPGDVERDGGRCLAVGELIVIRADPALVNPEYLLAFLRLDATREKIGRMVKGQSAHLYPADLRELEVVLPPRPVQDRIARINRDAEVAHRSALRRAKDDLAAAKALIRAEVFQDGAAPGQRPHAS